MTVTPWRILVSRVRSLLTRRRADADLDDELEGYVAMLIDRHRREGLAPAAARRAALVETGGVEQVKEAVRGVRVGHALHTGWRDVRYGARLVARAPGYAAVVVLTMALGIGVNAATFSVIHTVLWRPLPYPNADRLVVINVDARGVVNAGAAPGEALDLGAGLRTLTHVSLAIGVDASLNIDGVMDRVAAASATDDVLSLLGADPMWLGRPLHDASDEGHDRVKSIVISHELWMRRFHGDPGVIGRHVEVNNFDVEVVGVTRPGFRVYLPPLDHVADVVDIWFPTGLSRTRTYRYGPLVAQLAPGVGRAQAQAEIDAMAARFVAADPATYPDGQLHFRVVPLRDDLTRSSQPALIALGAAVAFVLLVACVNVANVMLARAKARERELAVRGALGATRMRLVCQLLAENVVLAAIGGASGWLVAIGGVALVGWLRPPHLPRQDDIMVGSIVLGWTMGLTVLASLIFGVVPAWLLTARGPQAMLNSGRGSALMVRSRRWQRGLVVAEVALSIVPLVAAGLMARTFVNLTRAPLGFDPAGVLTAAVPLNFGRFPDRDQRQALYMAAVDRVAHLSGVDAVSAGGPLPLSPLPVMRRCWADIAANSLPVRANQLSALPGFLHALGIRLTAGRDLTEDDLTRHRTVAIVDEELARALWGGEALGRRLAIENDVTTQTFEVVGVTAPIRTARVRDAGGPTFFIPYFVYDIDLSLVVKTHASMAAVGAALKPAVEALGTQRPIFDIQPLATIVDDSIGEERFTALVLVGFAAAALVLAAVGLYGTLSYLISQRTQEFGVRLALGASAAGLVRLVVREGSVLTIAGTAAGTAAAIGAATILRTLLYGVTPVDGLTLAGVAMLVAVVALVAIGQPAWRAARVDPAVALRNE
jgi:putative ABC transport system permease protein